MDKNKMVVVLEIAIELLETKGWHKGSYAIDQFNNRVPSDSEEACSFCLIGAISKAVLEVEKDDFDKACVLFNDIKRRLKRFVDSSLAMWNDASGRTKEDVVRLLRMGINNATQY